MAKPIERTPTRFKKMKKLDQDTLNYIKKQGYWKEGDVTYVIEEYEYPHDENCGGTMCWCTAVARKENPEKYQKWLEELKKLKK